jgi:Permuted papain-like amidase enzyme, YaeF/YiiX, C92 family
MNRTDLLTQARTGQVLLVASDTFLSSAIRWFEDCDFSHAALVIIINNEPFVIEALKKGMALTKLSDYMSDKSEKLGILHPNFAITIENEQKIIYFALPLAGRKRYGFFNLIGLQGLRYLCVKLFGQETEADWLMDQLNTDKRLICAEACAYILNSVIPGLFPEWREIAPKDLYLSNNFKFEEVV